MGMGKGKESMPKCETVDVPREPGRGCLEHVGPPERVAISEGTRRARAHATRRAVAIYNPASGRSRGQRTAEKLRVLLEKLAPEMSVELFATERAGHATEICRGLALRAGDTVVSVGGDGTLSEVVTGLMSRPGWEGERAGVALAVVAAGTGNTMASDLGMTSVRLTVEGIVAGNVRDIDIMEAKFVNGLQGAGASAGTGGGARVTRYMCNVLGFGLAVDSNILAEELRWMGGLRYDAATLREIYKSRPRHTTLTVDGEIIESDMTLILGLKNQTTGKNFHMCPRAQMDDGKLDILVLPNKSRMETLRLFQAVKSGGKHVYDESVRYVRAQHSVKIETPRREAINIDGENCGSTPLDLKVLPGALGVIVPRGSVP